MKIKAEPFDVMQYFYSDVQNPMMRCFIQMESKMNVNNLRLAVENLLQVYPILRCTYDRSKRTWKEGIFQTKDYLKVLETTSNQEFVAEQALLQELKIGIDPSIKIILIAGRTADTLCVLASHLLCDGRGFQNLLYEFAKMYSNTVAAAVKRQSEIIQNANTRTFSQIVKNIDLVDKIKIMTSKERKMDEIKVKTIPFIGKSENPAIIKYTITEVEFKKLQVYAKQQKVSMNDLFLTFYAKALHELFDWSKIKLPIPVDLRKFCKEKERNSICNLTGNYYCRVSIQKGEDFQETLQQISKQMKEQKKSLAVLKQPMLYHLLYHICPYQVLKKIFFKISPVPVTSYTNIGILDETKLYFKDCVIGQAFLATAIKPIPYFQLTVSTYKNQCTLSTCTYAGHTDFIMLKI